MLLVSIAVNNRLLELSLGGIKSYMQIFDCAGDQYP